MKSRTSELNVLGIRSAPLGLGSVKATVKSGCYFCMLDS